MATVEESPFASILRLGSQEWTFISSFLGSGDLLRLLLSGNSTLMRSLRQGRRYLAVSWNVPRYIDFAEVSQVFNQLDTVCSFTFKSDLGIRSWMAPHLGLDLPNTITELSLNFLGSIDLMLGSKATLPMSDRFPLLQSLRIVDEHRKRHTYTATLRLDSLPPSLLTLALRSTFSWHDFPQTLLQSLPHSLKTLDVDMMFLADSSQAAAKVPLTNLPPQLTFLRLSNNSHWHLNVDAALLPSSLRHIHLEFDLARVDFCWNNLSTHLPNLHTLIAPRYTVPITEAASWFPCALTRLEVALSSIGLASAAEGDLKSALVAISPALTSYSLTRDVEIGKLISNPEVSLPRLFDLRLVSHAPSYIQPSVKKILCQEILCEFPKELEECAWLRNQNPRSILTATYPPTLRSLRCPIDFLLPDDFMARLPTSLELFSGRFDIISQKALFQRAKLGELPKLRKVVNTAPIPCEMDFIPSQLIDFSFVLASQTLEAPAKPQVLESLQRSNIETLSLIVDGVEVSDTVLAAVIEILNCLPNSLTDLTLRLPRALTSDWPVVFPSKLKSLSFTSSAQVQFRADAKDCEQSICLQLPSSLNYLQIYLGEALPTSCLPPFLSQYNVFDSQGRLLETDYFVSRKPPHAGQSLNC